MCYMKRENSCTRRLDSFYALGEAMTLTSVGKLANLAWLALVAPPMLTIASASSSEARGAAAAQVPTPTTAGCLLVSNAFSKHATEEKVRPIAESVLYFFLGRIDPGTTTGQLKMALLQQGRLINSANATGLFNACLRQVQANGQMLQTAAQQIGGGK